MSPPVTEATYAAKADPVPEVRAIKPLKPTINAPDIIADLRQRLHSAHQRFSTTPPEGSTPPWSALPSDIDPAKQKFSPRYMAWALEQWQKLDFDDLQTRLNRFDHFVADIDWCHQLHFIHKRSTRPDAIPLLLLHGWPGSVWEFAESESDQAFHVVAASLPGFLWSSPPPSVAHYVGDIYGYSRILNALMFGLGYCSEENSSSSWSGYAVQGGDWGSCHARVLAAIPGSGVRAVHINFCPSRPPGLAGLISSFLLNNLSPAGQLWLARKIGPPSVAATVEKALLYQESGVYYRMQGCRPAQLVFSLLDSPAGLLGYVGPLITSWVDDEQRPNKEQKHGLTLDKLLELVTLYWITGTIDKRLYIRQPLGYSAFPKEIISPPVPWVKATGNLRWAVAAPSGGHFPHIELPNEYVAHMRQAFSDGGKAVATSYSAEPSVPLHGLWDEERLRARESAQYG